MVFSTELTCPIADESHAHADVVVPGGVCPYGVPAPPLVHLPVPAHCEVVPDVPPGPVELVEVLHPPHGPLARLGGVTGRRDVGVVDHHVRHWVGDVLGLRGRSRVPPRPRDDLGVAQ